MRSRTSWASSAPHGGLPPRVGRGAAVLRARARRAGRLVARERSPSDTRRDATAPAAPGAHSGGSPATTPDSSSAAIRSSPIAGRAQHGLVCSPSAGPGRRVASAGLRDSFTGAPSSRTGSRRPADRPRRPSRAPARARTAAPRRERAPEPGRTAPRRAKRSHCARVAVRRSPRPRDARRRGRRNACATRSSDDGATPAARTSAPRGERDPAASAHAYGGSRPPARQIELAAGRRRGVIRTGEMTRGDEREP